MRGGCCDPTNHNGRRPMHTTKTRPIVIQSKNKEQETHQERFGNSGSKVNEDQIVKERKRRDEQERLLHTTVIVVVVHPTSSIITTVTTVVILFSDDIIIVL